ncbi:DNA/RNA non-specific endonuclease [Tumebacillus flagellatus]|uniref:Type VII secretion system protein EssD-like domain-containing protein n=1 Tax=Tumebacillus flagellatus TaxID=1157490 RepID=A0A074LP23_9BACL|nr:DNA/RNA non-specific endonuclease [Tumebacillus flagellatus]KEO81578.1 hypothetical protein EL26_20045 [Tumebacillus flagellatus]
MASWEYSGESQDDLHHRQNLAHQAARLRHEADSEAEAADSWAAGMFHALWSSVPDVVVLPEAVWSYMKRHPDLREQDEGTTEKLSVADLRRADDEYNMDRGRMYDALRGYYLSKQPDYLPESTRRNAVEQDMVYYYDLTNEQLYDRLQDLIQQDEQAAYYQSLIHDPDFDAEAAVKNDPGYVDYIKEQSAQNETPGSMTSSGMMFLAGMVKAMGPKYGSDRGGGGEQYTREGRKKVLKPNNQYESNGYLYTTDDQGRIVKVEGELDFGTAKRNKYAQGNDFKGDRLQNDDGGHLIASMFNGSGNLDNLVPMNKDINRVNGKWYNLEQMWKRALEAEPPKNVRVTIQPIYEGSSQRPISFKVTYKIDNDFPKVIRIENKAGG